MPLSSVPDLPMLNHDPHRTVNNEVRRVVATFRDGEVVVVWYSPDGKTCSFHPQLKQRAHLFTCHAPGIAPAAVESVTHRPASYTDDRHASVDVVFIEYKDDLHVATPQDEARRQVLQAMAHSDATSAAIVTALNATYDKPPYDTPFDEALSVLAAAGEVAKRQGDRTNWPTFLAAIEAALAPFNRRAVSARTYRLLPDGPQPPDPVATAVLRALDYLAYVVQGRASEAADTPAEIHERLRQVAADLGYPQPPA